MSGWEPLATEWTRPSQELANFTNRESEFRVFERLLYLSAKLSLPVLSFYGVGGIGKTWLAKRLREVAHSAVPTARIDFDPSSGGARLQDLSQIVAEIRVQFRQCACPRFDLAYAWVRYKEGGGGEPHFHGEGALAGAWELVSEVTEAVATETGFVPGANLVKWLMQKLSAPARSRFRQSRLADWLDSHLGSKDWQKLRAADRDEIFRELPSRLVRDLNESLPSRSTMACRGVLFLDSFEALRSGLHAEQRGFEREAAIRDLYHPESPLLLVVCGRDKLRWDEADVRWQDHRHLEQHLVGGLSEDDARRFLTKCGLVEPPMQEAVLRVALDVETESGEASSAPRPIGYHAFSLGLCADTVSSEERLGRGEGGAASFDMVPGDTQSLARRFLRSLHDDATDLWVKRLAWTPRFDEEAARAAFGGPHTGVETGAAWRQLRTFSFVQPADSDGWYRLHSRMRFALCRMQGEQTDDARLAHEFWREHWTARSVTDADDIASLAWYHDWHLAPSDALATWRRLTEDARRAGRMLEHSRLLNWWAETDLLERPSIDLGPAALNCLAIELVRSIQGDRTAVLKKAVACCEAALRLCTEQKHPEEWAATQHSLGVVLQELPTADHATNVAQAVACCEAALRVRTEHAWPADWAATMDTLGNACQRLSTGIRESNLRRAIACYEAALRVRTEAAFPQDWATTQSNLGAAHTNSYFGERAQHLNSAIACFRAALRVRTRDEFPRLWGWTQHNLGLAYAELLSGDREENLKNAVDCYEAVLQVFTENAYPKDWAMAQVGLASVYEHMVGGDPAENLRKAIACDQAALRIITEDAFPWDWAMVQTGLAGLYHKLPSSEGIVEHVIECCNSALRVFTPESNSEEWARTQWRLGAAYQQSSSGDRELNLSNAIGCYRAALRILTERVAGRDCGLIHENLAALYLARKDGDETENTQRAIESFESALGVFTEEAYPLDWARIQHTLGQTHLRLTTGDRTEHLKAALTAYQSSLRVYTEHRYPLEWARARHNIGVVHHQLPSLDRPENLRAAIICYQATLRVYTRDRHPELWAATQEHLAAASRELADILEAEAGDAGNGDQQS
jgi:tetratricopeptide (TPR) repeat protein